MKKINILLHCVLTAALIFTLSNSLYSQYNRGSRLELSASGTYLFGGILSTTNGELNFVNNFGFVGDLNYHLNNGTAIGISYSYIPTELRYRDYLVAGSETKLFNMDLHYFYLNYIVEKDQRKATPYLMVGFGGVLAHPRDKSYNDVFRFAGEIGGGIKIYFSNKVGFKLQARLLLPYYAASVGVYAGTGGVGYGVSAGAVIQADISAGLTYKF